MSAPTERILEALAACGCHPKPTREGTWQARCPAHADHEPSLSIRQAEDGRALIKCFGGCETEAVVAALGLGMRDLFPDDGGKTAAPVSRLAGKHPGNSSCVALAGQGITLAAFAKSRRLDPALLEAVGVKERRQRGRPYLEVPYFGSDGKVIAVRKRLAFEGSRRFRWRPSDKPHFYGLNRLAEARRAGWVLLVEGESDCWACWQAGLPCLGIPGKSTWKSEWAAALDGLEPVLWQEPDAADLTARLASDLPDLRVIVADGYKDPAEAHAAGLDLAALIAHPRAKAPLARDVSGSAKAAAAIWSHTPSVGHRTVEHLDKVPAQSGSVTVRCSQGPNSTAEHPAAAQPSEAELERLAAEAKPALDGRKPLEYVESALRALGLAGDVRPALLLYLCATTRLLPRRYGAPPAHALLLGPSSSGKSFTTDTVLALLPPEAVHRIAAGSPRALIYDNEPLEHRVVYFGEADSLPAGEDNPAASAVRNLLQDGELAYDVVERDTASRRHTTRRVRRPGPTVLVTTATRRLGEQLMTRLFELEVSDSPAQFAAALREHGRREAAGCAVGDPGELAEVRALRAVQAYLQLRAPLAVVVPFASQVADYLARQPLAPRLQRDFPRLLALIKAHALLCEPRRERDHSGRLVATLADYAAVHALVAETFAAAASGGASAAVRETVAAAAELLDADAGHSGTVSLSKLAVRLGLSKSATKTRIDRAIRGGWLVNDEDRRGRPARLRLGEPLPAEVGLLTPDELAERLGVRVFASGAHSIEHSERLDLQAKDGGCSSVRRLTDDKCTQQTSDTSDDAWTPPPRRPAMEL